MADTMQALVYHNKNNFSLQTRPIPTILDPRDAIVHVTRTSISTSDLHIIAGSVPRAKEDIILGHEFVGKIVDIGPQVRKLAPGLRVAANCETFCGECFFCQRGYVNNCIHGGWELGCRIDGSHAEFVRVPFADNCLTPIPDKVTDGDALFIGDILSTGYFAAELADIRPGDTVAVIGAGPVGMCAMMCARLFGAARVVAIEPDVYRLSIATGQGLADTGIDPTFADALTVIQGLTDGRGADAVIEAAGGEDTFQTAWKIARPNAAVAVVAMYDKPQSLPLDTMYGKNLHFKTGGVDATHCAELMRLIEMGKLNTGMLATHRGRLADIENAYRTFAARTDNCLKWSILTAEG